MQGNWILSGGDCEAHWKEDVYCDIKIVVIQEDWMRFMFTMSNRFWLCYDVYQKSKSIRSCCEGIYTPTDRLIIDFVYINGIIRYSKMLSV